MCFRSISKADIEQGEMLISKRYRNRRLGEYLKELDLIDVPMYSKIERGERRAKREQMVKLAEFLNQDKTEFLSLWLADKILDVVESEDAINLGAHDRLLNDW